MNEESRFYDCIVGEKLTAITFVLDYWQLQFDGPTINALTRVQVNANGNASRDGDDQFRNLICGQIGKIVSKITLAESEVFAIAFEDGSSISISLRAEEYRGPEAIVFNNGNQFAVL